MKDFYWDIRPNPEFGTIMRIVRALGLTLSAHPAADGRASKRRRVA
jgi:gamma-glutamyl:cysteine ligase YbdK (ATP-grasp superfamily)